MVTGVNVPFTVQSKDVRGCWVFYFRFLWVLFGVVFDGCVFLFWFVVFCGGFFFPLKDEKLNKSFLIS